MDNYPIPVTGDDYFRRQEKRQQREARRPNPTSAADLLGPGFASRAIQVLDWNSQECTFNGFFYSVQTALNTPDGTSRWIGHVISQDDANGVQMLTEAEPPEGTVTPPDPDPEVPLPDDDDPEPEPPDEGNVTPIRQYLRYFSISPEGDATFTEWEAAGGSGGGRLRDLADVKIFEPLVDKSVLLWKADYNDGEGAWVNYSWVPGINDVNERVDDLLDDLEELIDIQDAKIMVFRQPDEPVPGVGDTPLIVPDGSLWFDTDDGYRIHIWDTDLDPDAWREITDALLDGVQEQLDDLNDEIADLLVSQAAVIADMNEINTVVIPAIEAQAAAILAENAAIVADITNITDVVIPGIEAQADAATAAAAAATADVTNIETVVIPAIEAQADAATAAAADAIEAASLAQAIIGDNLILNGDFKIESGGNLTLWTAQEPDEVHLSQADITDEVHAMTVVVDGTSGAGQIYQEGVQARLPAIPFERYYVSVGAKALNAGRQFRLIMRLHDENGDWTGSVNGAYENSIVGTAANAYASRYNTTFQVPAGTRFVSFGVEVRTNQAGTFFFADFTVNKVMAAETIGPGAITETKITDDAITSPKIATNAVTSDSITALAIDVKHTMIAPTFKTVTNVGTGIAPNIIKGILLNGAGLVAYNGDGPTLTITAATGAISMKGSLTSGSSITGTDVTGGTVTGALIQTIVTAARGIKITTTGLTAYDAVGTPTLSILAADGSIAMKGAITSGSTITGTDITGGTVTGAILQTIVTASRGVKITTAGLTAYDAVGTPTMTILASDGSIALKGAINSGSTITGTNITGGTVTGAMLQTVSGAGLGVKISSTGMVVYSDGTIPGTSNGTPMLTITASGAITMRGALTSPVITGGEITGAIFQTHVGAVQGIKMTGNAIVGYQAGNTGVSNFYLDANTGLLAVTGSVVTGGDINGATVTGGTVQSTSTPSRGVKFNSNGIVGYDGSGNPVFTILATTGQGVFRGAITSGSIITGAEYWTDGSSGADHWRLGVNTQRNYLAAFAGAMPVAGGISVVYNGTNFDGVGGWQGTTMEFAAPNWDGTHTLRPMVRLNFGRQGSSGGSTRYSRLELHGETVSIWRGQMKFEAQPPVQPSATNKQPLVVDTSTGFVFKAAASSRRYKTDFLPPTFTGEDVLDVEVEEFTYKADPAGERVHGMMAERLAELGFEQWVNRDEKGRPDSIRPDQWSIAQQVALRYLRDENNDLKDRVARLERVVETLVNLS